MWSKGAPCLASDQGGYNTACLFWTPQEGNAIGRATITQQGDIYMVELAGLQVELGDVARVRGSNRARCFGSS